MTKPLSRTEQRVFAAAERDALIVSERQAAETQRTIKVDRLRALRLAKEASDAETAAAKPPVSPPRKTPRRT